MDGMAMMLENRFYAGDVFVGGGIIFCNPWHSDRLNFTSMPEATKMGIHGSHAFVNFVPIISICEWFGSYEWFHFVLVQSVLKINMELPFYTEITRSM